MATNNDFRRKNPETTPELPDSKSNRRCWHGAISQVSRPVAPKPKAATISLPKNQHQPIALKTPPRQTVHRPTALQAPSHKTKMPVILRQRAYLKPRGLRVLTQPARAASSVLR